MDPSADATAIALGGGAAPYTSRAPPPPNAGVVVSIDICIGCSDFAVIIGHPPPPTNATLPPNFVLQSFSRPLTSTPNFAPSDCAICITSSEHRHPAASDGASSARTESIALQHRFDARTPPRPAHGNRASLNLLASHASAGGGDHTPPICLLTEVGAITYVRPVV